jgi:GT2 family glycosyltransferase
MSYEVWVIDNCSTDGSGEMICKDFPEVNLLENHENLGFARANNLAIEKSAGDFVMLLNPDTVIENDVIEEMLNFIKKSPDIGAVGPRLENPDGSLQESAYPEPSLIREFWRMFHLDRFHYFAVYPMDRWPLNQARQVDVLMGACLLVRRKVIEQVGLLDETFFMYSEEVDFCTRIRNFGWRIFWLPHISVTHFGGQSTQQISQEMFLQLYQAKIQYFRKHYSLFVVWLYKFVLLMAAMARLLLTPFAYLEKTSKKVEHLELSSNYRRLLWSLPYF